MNNVTQINCPASACSNEDAIFRWLAGYIGTVLHMDARRICPADSLVDLGLDSVASTALVIELESQFGVRLKMDTVFSQPTIGDIGARVMEQLIASQGSVSAV
ncbi:acyl carrier protein [Paraburkholderia kururiensis]|uniref:acyl carrier protein n=1 Tax=Paraburkholderia kururiensis TaxID=984307 RepID=UPI000F87D6D0|nr:acyl carrier protein [Paraburkholderia kururiensis]